MIMKVLEIESGMATRCDGHDFIYRVTETLLGKKAVRLCVIAGAPGKRRIMNELMLDL